MTLTGTYARNLDTKQRLAVPKRLRDQFGGEEITNLFVAPGTETSLVLYAPSAFERLARRMAKRASNRSDVRNYLRLFYSRAENVELDGQGRIRIPERLVTFAGLDHDVVLLGVHDHAEIWDRGLWNEFLEQHTADFDDMATHAFE